MVALNTSFVIGPVELDSREPCFNLRYEIRIPISSELVRLLAAHTLDNERAELVRRSIEDRATVAPVVARLPADDAERDPLSAAVTVYTFRVMYPVPFVVLVTAWNVGTDRGRGEGTWRYAEDRVVSLEDAVRECSRAGTRQLYDEEFARLVERADATFWAEIPLLPLERVEGHGGRLGVRLGRETVYFAEQHRIAYRLLWLMLPNCPDDQVPADEVMTKLDGNTTPQRLQRWAQNLCNIVNRYLRGLPIAYRLVCPKPVSGQAVVRWERLIDSAPVPVARA